MTEFAEGLDVDMRERVVDSKVFGHWKKSNCYSRS